jgi:hypothetical protein
VAQLISLAAIGSGVASGFCSKWGFSTSHQELLSMGVNFVPSGLLLFARFDETIGLLLLAVGEIPRFRS